MLSCSWERVFMEQILGVVLEPMSPDIDRPTKIENHIGPEDNFLLFVLDCAFLQTFSILALEANDEAANRTFRRTRPDVKSWDLLHF